MPENKNLGVQTLDKPWEARHDLSVTRETIKRLLAGGTPQWAKHPSDFKAMARESYLADKEISERMTRRYRIGRQEDLLNEQARKVNPIRTRDFIEKLRKSGVKCYTIDNALPGTVGLWAFKPGTDKVVPVAYLQVPAMYEFSVLRLDKRGLPAGESFRGWRVIETQLIQKGIISEAQAHKIFGYPVDGPVSYIFRRDLFWFRNRRELQATPEEIEL
jgi:hypothetical protein